jgi:CxxC-x17-CxxC domain-containing protein
MRDFRRDNRSDKKHSFSNRGGSDRPQMHSATCANCGKACEVPFRPTGSKPVLCRDCFRNDSGSDSRRFDSRNSGRSNFEERRMYSATCASCGNSCQVPFQPSDGRPVFCTNCFEKNGDQDTRRPERKDNERPSFENKTPAQPNYKVELDALNAKVDKILEILSSAMAEAEEEETEEEPVEEVQVAEAVEEKPKEKKAPKKKAKAASKKTTTPKTK